MLVHRLDDVIYCPFFFSSLLEELGSSCLSFFTLTNNNKSISTSTIINNINFPFVISLQLMVTALHSRRGGWPPQ